MIITRTPFRVSFFGGGTDYRPWFEKNGCLVIGAAIARYCYISVRKLPPFFDYKTRAVYSEIESVQNPSEFKHPAIRHCLQYLQMDEGLEIHHDGDLPARSGIGSSSSFTVGFLNALHAHRYEMFTKNQLAREAIFVEQEVIQENVGIQDQILAAYGGIQLIEAGGDGQFQVTPLVLSPEYVRNFESHLMLGFTGINRIASKVASRQIENIQKGALNSELSQMTEISKEALKLFRKKATPQEFGHLMDQAWTLKKSFSTEISNENLDHLIQKGIENGAYGGKLLGAGGGGFILLVAPPEKQPLIRQALQEIQVWVPFQFDWGGTQIIFHGEVDAEFRNSKPKISSQAPLMNQ